MPDEVLCVPGETLLSGAGAAGESVHARTGATIETAVTSGASGTLLTSCTANVGSWNNTYRVASGAFTGLWGNVGYVNTNFCWCEPAVAALSGIGYVRDSEDAASGGQVVLLGTSGSGAFSPALGAAYLALSTSGILIYCNPTVVECEGAAEVSFTTYPGLRVISKIRNPPLQLTGGFTTVASYIFNKALELIGDNAIDFEWHVIKAALMSTLYTPDIDDDEYWEDVEMFELEPSAVYTEGGVVLNDPVKVRNDSIDQVSITWNTVTWIVGEGQSLSGMKGILLYDSSIPRSPLIAFMEFQEAMSVPELNSFQVTPVIRIINSGS